MRDHLRGDLCSVVRYRVHGKPDNFEAKVCITYLAAELLPILYHLISRDPSEAFRREEVKHFSVPAGIHEFDDLLSYRPNLTFGVSRRLIVFVR